MTESRRIFDDRSFRVRAVDGHGSDAVVVTFAPWRRQQDLEGPAFGEDFLRGLGIDAFHVTCARNDWY